MSRNRRPGAGNAGSYNGIGNSISSLSLNFSLALERSNAHLAIELAKARHPALCRYGIWSKPCDDDFSVDGVMTALIYLRRFPKQSTPRWSSYGLKHFAEDWGRAHALEAYIANGELICAAAYLRLPINWSGNSPNVAVGVRLPRGYVSRAMNGEVD
jgi:hypothetical protein